MSYRELLAPAIEAAKGHPLDFWAAAQHARNVGKISAYPSSVEILMKNGHPIAAGELFVQTDLARTLTTIARDGADVFYRGALARKSADFYAEQGGLLSKDDLAKYVAEQAEPIHTAYAGLDVYQSAPNSQGIVMLIAINILEGYDLEALGHNSVEYLHEYFLNNRTPYFSLEEDDVNVLVPGKRTRHTVNPALALKDGKPYLAWNTPGGDNQPQAMLQAFLAIVHFGANVQQAVEAAIVTSSAFRASMYPGRIRGMLTMPAGLGEHAAKGLAAKGHRVEVLEAQQPYMQAASGAGAVKMLMIDPKTGTFYGGVSPAKSDYVLGW